MQMSLFVQPRRGHSMALSLKTIQLLTRVVKLLPDIAYYSMILPKQQQAGYFNCALCNVVDNE